ncbi:hypothetical protein Clacol_005362 [Clathrus columnatus]|uniref:NACHT domain-containing protein n=1 Tax=Clathrus columnatus TaxID=1419009 RepID=A0AAV5A925_9AGAM|nr:hypothetical protein Clacol_005362 [Clathrus columnatus]
MDHFILPPGTTHYITVPYKCTEPYDNGDFYTYPERKGWTADDVEGKDEYGHRRPEDIEIFLQSWLFFGVLVEVFKIVNIKVDTDDFIDHDTGLVTTHKLTELLEKFATVWKKKWPKDISELASTPKAVAITKVLTTVFRVMRPFCYDVSIGGRPSVRSSLLSPEIVVSIVGLTTTFLEAGKYLYMEFGNQSLIDGGTPLLRSILRKKWCPFHVTAMQIELRLDAQYYLAALPGLPEAEFKRHSNCTEIRCTEKPVDEDTYVLKHAVAGCSCQLVPIPIEDLLDTIKQGDTPVISFHKDDDDSNPRLEVKAFNTTTASSLPYISISHVWSDSMGNPKENALPACLLESIQKMVNQVRYLDREPDREHVYFWMDTLCIPVDPKYDEQRKTLIIKMRQIYQEASAVLVLESQLQTVLSTLPLAERCVNFYATKWVRRLWTYQEGGLSKWLAFQFSDKSLELHDVYAAPDLHAPKHRGASMISQRRQSVAFQFTTNVQLQFGLVYSAMYHWGIEDNMNSMRWAAFLPIASSYSSRMTTRQSDEPLCLASVMHIDTTPLVRVKGPDGLKSSDKEVRRRADRVLTDQRMAILYRSVGKFQDLVIFSKYPRLPIEGFRWAPRTYLGELPWFSNMELEQSYKKEDERYATIYTYKMDKKEKAGLLVTFPLITFDYHSNVDTAVGENFLVSTHLKKPSGKAAALNSGGTTRRYLVEPVNVHNDPEGFVWTIGASYSLIMQVPQKKRVVGKPALAVLGRILPWKKSTKYRIRHERLVQVTLLPLQSSSGELSIPKLEGTEGAQRLRYPVQSTTIDSGMKKLLQTFSKKKKTHEGSHSEIPQLEQTSSNNDDNNQHIRPNGISAPLADNELDRGELDDDSMREVSQVLDGARDITEKHLERDNKAYRYKEVTSNVVQRLSAFANFVQGIANVHPYAKMAWAIISGAVNVNISFITAVAFADISFQAIFYTQDVDQNILDLFETLDVTYKFIEEAKEIENYLSYKRILSTLAKQTVDCAYFIRDYAKNANFWIRVGKNIIGGPIKARIETYRTTFRNLLEEFRTHSSLHTELAVGRPALCRGCWVEYWKKCLFGTRIEVLDEIIEWINDGDESCPRLFWLAGPAGVGKSAIAHSIAVQFESIGRLGSFFCFDRNYSLERRRDKVFSTIARDLADLDVRIKHELAKVIQNKTSLRTTTDLHLQWKNFIFEPLKAISEVSTGPILIIVDALDECGDNSRFRQDLLKVLETKITSLPDNVRFLVTSRPENDIKLTFKKLEPYIRTKMMDTIPESESKRDILTYLKANLDTLGDARLMHLVGLSQGLFQWAYLTSQFLNGLGNNAGLTIIERYEDLISTQHIRSINDPLDFMYTQILSSLFDPDDSRVMTRFRSIIGSIITSFEPLSLKALAALHGDGVSSFKREEDIKVAIQYMGSLLGGIDEPSSTIRPLHVSFREYLLDSNRSRKFSINSSPCHHDFAVGCIRTMIEGLRFNICDIPDSYKRNSDYEDLPTRVSSSISIPLLYSCRFWALHVSSTGFDLPLARRVEEFLHHGFLLWLEVLSLVKAIHMAAKLISCLISWSSRGKSHKGLYDFAVDGKRFVQLFGDAIALSAPHIYLSALPFCPQNSIVYKTYVKQFPNILRIASNPICDWSLDSTGSNVGYVDCISFSHGGEYLAIGMLDRGIFKLLDSETFDILLTGEVPNNEVIWAIQFSLDGRTVVLATHEKVYFFDILTGGLTFHWDIESTYGIISTLWKTRFSQNARYIAFLCEYNLVVWDLETKEETINISFDNQYGNIAGFDFSSSDGLFITYFVDIGAQVWDLETGTVFHGPFQPPQNITIDRTIVSPNEKDIFLLDNDGQLYKWNFRDKSLIDFNTGYPISNILISPNGDCVVIDCLVRLVLRDMNGNQLHYNIDGCHFRSTFSKDGRHLAIFEGGSLKIWKLDRWQSIPNIRQSTLPSVRPEFGNALSDGKYLLVEDQTRWTKRRHYYEMWDVELQQPIQKPIDFASITTPIFSPLGRYLAYLPDRRIVTIYDIHSGITKEFLSNDRQIHIDCLALSQDEMCIATLDLSRGRIDLWGVTSCQIVDTLTIPKAKNFEYCSMFRASSNFRHFAYFLPGGDIFLVSRTRLISVNSLISEQVDYWIFEDFSFSLDEEYLLVSCGSTILHINLIKEECRTVVLCRNDISDLWEGPRRIHFISSSDAILVEVDSSRGYNIWDAFSGQLLYSCPLEYPDIDIYEFIPVHQYLFTRTRSFSRILTLDAKRNDLICFSSNEQHSLKNLPLGSSASLRKDGWIITQKDELLFWVPNMYHETLYIPKLKFIIEGRATELDLSSFSHGQSWASCRVTADGTIFE